MANPDLSTTHRVKVLNRWYLLRRDDAQTGYDARPEIGGRWHHANSIAFALIRAWNGIGDPEQLGREVKKIEHVYALTRGRQPND